jgi:hypothetical protein
VKQPLVLADNTTVLVGISVQHENTQLGKLGLTRDTMPVQLDPLRTGDNASWLEDGLHRLVSAETSRSAKSSACIKHIWPE